MSGTNIEQNYPEPEDPELLGKIKRYREDAIDALQSAQIELTEDKSLRVILQNNKEIIFRSPKELFCSGGNEGEGKMEDERQMLADENARSVMGTPICLQFEDGPRWKYFTSADDRDLVKKDIQTGFVAACAGTRLECIDHFADFSEGEIDDVSVSSRDLALRRIDDTEISEKLRFFALYEGAIRHPVNTREQDSFDLLRKMDAEDPDFVNKFLDFSLRKCLTSGHEWSFGLFRFLRADPKRYENLAQVHKDYSIPYLLERDYFYRMTFLEDNRDEERKELEKEIKDNISELGLDLSSIRKRLKELTASDSGYLPGF